MKRSILAGFSLLTIFLGSTVMPAQARWDGDDWGYHHHGWARSLGWGLGGLGLGLGLGVLGARAYYDDRPYYGGNPYYGGYYSGRVNVYTEPTYGYGGYYWY